MPSPPVQTSAVGAYLPVEGAYLQLLTGSPATFTTICNVADWTEPLKADTVDVTNFGDLWHRRAPTLLDMGKLSLKIWWVPTEPTHENQVDGIGGGLRYMLLNRLLGTWKIVYPDASSSADAFPAYVTGFSLTGKVGAAWEATVELSNSGAPTLV